MREWLHDPVLREIAIRLLSALGIGALIGLERSYHGRAAGFRTHALVCLSTSLLMLVTVYESRWFPGVSEGRVSLDPTRLAQGIMTGIGFLGAGTIMKDNLTVRGLTTAASVWITAAIGILMGVGFYFPALLAAVLTLGTLSVFRWIESMIRAQFYAHFYVRFERQRVIPESELRALIAQHAFTITNMSYRFERDEDYLEYRMIIRTNHADNARRLSETLAQRDTVREFRISPSSE